MHNHIPSRLFIILFAIHFIHCGCPGKPAPGPSTAPQDSSGSINLTPPPVLTPITDDMIQLAENEADKIGPDYHLLVEVLTSLKAGINTAIEDRNVYDHTALHIAAMVGNVSIIQALLDRNADVNATDRWGETPMWRALDNEKLDAALLLIKTGKIAKPNLEVKAFKAGTPTALAYAIDQLAKNTTDPATNDKWQAIIDALRAAGAEK